MHKQQAMSIVLQINNTAVFKKNQNSCTLPLAKNSKVNYRNNTIVLSLNFTVVKFLL